MTAGDREIARLKWQCRRGMLELDLALEAFVRRDYAGLSAAQQRTFKKLLECPDQLLFDYLFGATAPIDKDVADVIERIRSAAAP